MLVLLTVPVVCSVTGMLPLQAMTKRLWPVLLQICGLLSIRVRLGVGHLASYRLLLVVQRLPATQSVTGLRKTSIWLLISVSVVSACSTTVVLLLCDG